MSFQEPNKEAEKLGDLRPVVISGPSGVGKGTLIQKLRDTHPDVFAATVSHTTRQPRSGEAEGESYYFVTPSAFSDLIAQEAFVEYTEFSGNQYGTSKQTISDQKRNGRIPLLDIDLEGVKSLKKAPNIHARYVFIKPPSLATLEARIRSRGTETEDAIQERLARAEFEINFAESSDAHDIVIANDDLEKAYRDLEAFIFGSP